MRKWFRSYGIFIALFLFLVGWSILLYFISPEKIVQTIGINNSYVVTFLLAVFGGFSSFTGTSFYATIVALAQGGPNRLILGAVGGFGLFLSDSAFYYVATRGVSIMSTRWKKVFDRIEVWVEEVPRWVVYLGIFAYAAFAPFPSDILLAVLAASSFSYRKFFPFLLAGDVTIALLLTQIVT